MTKTHYTILVIDDNDINRKYLKSVLSNNEIEPILAQSGEEALELLKKFTVNLVLIDIQMPGMDGFECFRQIKSMFGLTCPMLAVTAFSDQTDKDKVLKFGFNDFIVKPVKPDVLLNTIRYWINISSQVAETDNSSEDGHIDYHIINDLLRFTDSDSLFGLINEFMEETKVQVQSISFLKSAKEYTKILSILHVVKGNAGSFGFTILSSLAAEIEGHIKENRLEQADSELDEMLKYTDFLLRDYHRLLKID